MISIIAAALTLAAISLTTILTQSLNVANSRALNPLGRLGADMVLTTLSPPDAWLDANQMDKGITEAALKRGGVAKSASKMGLVEIENSETASDTIYRSEVFSVNLEQLGFFQEAFTKKLKGHQAIDSMRLITLLGHGYSKQTTAKIITEETTVKPVQISDADLAELEKKAEADPIYKKFAEEQRQIYAGRSDENYTEAEVQRAAELGGLAAERKMQVFNELRPDAFPTSFIAKIKVKPSAPRIEDRAETVGAIVPDQHSGLLTAADITDGGYFRYPDEEAVILRQDFAAKRGLKVGDTWPIFDKKLPVIGLAWPGLRQNVPDVFLTRGWLKKTYNLKLVNLLLVKAKSAKDIPALKKFIEKEAPGAIVTTDRSIGKKISGSVIDTKKLVYSYGLLTNLLVVFVCLLILILINIYRMSRRRRDIAVLMAIGWSRTRLFSQSLLESLILGLGAFGLGALATIYGVGVVNQRIKPLTVTMPRWEEISGLKEGLGFYTQNSDSFNRSPVVDTLKLKLQVDYTSLVLIGVAAVAVIVLVGAVATVRMFAVRPSDALREP